MAAILRAWHVPLLIHQPAYSLFNRKIESGLFEAVEQVGAGMIAFSPLAQGLLTSRYLQGIPADSLPRLFSRFYRASNASSQNISGMGVGLYVVREIVSLHGGTVDVRSREGQGSTFAVILPLAEG